LRLSVKSEYACLALIDLVERYDQGLSKIAGIASRKKIPKKYLEQILLILNRNGYVSSRKGAEGGYRLAKAPDRISLAEILRLMDGALAPVYSVSEYFYEPTPIERNPNLLRVFKEIRDVVAARLESVSFDQLV
jgi:Rrf2 family protein